MREGLAESLLARVMEWDEADVAAQRPVLQALADHKYDGYEQYRPGMRFLESLARWLRQFPDVEQRRDAYTLVRERLVYISRAELQHLVASVHPDLIRPRLVARAAADAGVRPHRVQEVGRHPALAVRTRSCLYVGLSDGARTDVLRRTATAISNEQVVADYHGLRARRDGLLKDLAEALTPEIGAEEAARARFSTLVLLDDFSASGISYLREEDGARRGKLAKLARQLETAGDLLAEDLHVHVVLYVATDQAMRHLEASRSVLEELIGATWAFHRLQALGDELVIRRGEDPRLDELIDAVYDPVINDRHMAKGGTDGRYGFADCGLPVVLAHNTPNNSLALLWADMGRARALFPRVSRHREEL